MQTHSATAKMTKNLVTFALWDILRLVCNGPWPLDHGHESQAGKGMVQSACICVCIMSVGTCSIDMFVVTPLFVPALCCLFGGDWSWVKMSENRASANEGLGD